MSNPIYYLAHPYSDDPEKSIKKAFYWTRQLRDKGLAVFSPVMHTHYYHVYFKNGGMPTYEDYVAWDLAIFEKMLGGKRAYCKECDLHFSEKTYSICPSCLGDLDVEWEKYDSNVVMLLSETAIKAPFHSCLNWCYEAYIKGNTLCDAYESNEITWEKIWNSPGCRQEYERAKQKFVRILCLEVVLELLPLIKGDITVKKILAKAQEKGIEVDL